MDSSKNANENDTDGVIHSQKFKSPDVPDIHKIYGKLVQP